MGEGGVSGGVGTTTASCFGFEIFGTELEFGIIATGLEVLCIMSSINCGISSLEPGSDIGGFEKLAFCA